MSVLARFFGLVLGLAALAAGPPAHATTFTTLHSFSGADGANPVAGLVFGANGALYGTTGSGGPSNFGTVFKLNPVTKTLTTLHAFTNGTDGANPQAGLVFDTKGGLYGTTIYGGPNNAGTVFKLDPATETLTTLYSFISGSSAFPNDVLRQAPRFTARPQAYMPTEAVFSSSISPPRH
jgi:uncharacterized repeat protein (TIGR03803 family)